MGQRATTTALSAGAVDRLLPAASVQRLVLRRPLPLSAVRLQHLPAQRQTRRATTPSGAELPADVFREEPWGVQQAAARSTAGLPVDLALAREQDLVTVRRARAASRSLTRLAVARQPVAALAWLGRQARPSSGLTAEAAAEAAAATRGRVIQAEQVEMAASGLAAAALAPLMSGKPQPAARAETAT